MAKNLILFHGKPKKEKFLNPNLPKPNRANWFPYAMQEAAKLGITGYTPQFDQPYDPSRDELLATFDAQPLHSESIVCGHSLGARVILEGMTRRSELVVSKLILVAPWIDPRGNYDGLGRWEINPNLIERSISGMTVYHSTKDDDQAKKSFEIVHDLFPTAKFIDIPEYGHFMVGNTMQSDEFPELIDEFIYTEQD